MPAKLSWVRRKDDSLLDVRLCDLGVEIEGTPLQDRVERLYDELAHRGIRLRPHVWLSSEWFSPDGIPGIALPFYLAHPRLAKIEKKMMLEVEGGGEAECMRLLRHEAGHAISTAYRLHYKKRWREVFGKVSRPYLATYKAVPTSRNYVLHLPWWYAQAHPAEDFAETFAVWLKPRSKWRKDYRNWPALRKLEYVDEVMADLAGVSPPVRSRRRIEPLRQLDDTLRRHYRKKQRRYAQDTPEVFDRDLKRLFTAEATGRRTKASAFLRRVRRRVRETVADWTGEYRYTIDQVIGEMIRRCDDLGLRLAAPEAESHTNALMLVTVQTMRFLQQGSHRIPL